MSWRLVVLLVALALAGVYFWLGLHRTAFVTAVGEVELQDSPYAPYGTPAVALLKPSEIVPVAGCADTKSTITPYIERDGRRLYLGAGRYDFQKTNHWTLSLDLFDDCPFPDYVQFGRM